MAKKKSKENVSRLKEICDKINNGNFGGDNKDALLFFGEGGSKLPQSERFPTGSVSLDWALGGGWPLGRVCEVFGSESSGKSTLTLHAMAEFQKAFPQDYVAIIDSEFSFDPIYAREIGVNVENILINQPESGEQALNVLEQLVDEGVKMIVVDSVAALTTQAELTSNIGDPQVAVQARLMSGALKKIVRKVSIAKAFVLFTNQVRDKIGVSWGEKTTQPGGRALKFYTSCRISLSAIGKDKEGDSIVSTRIKAVVKKNKTAAPFREAVFTITFGKGIDKIAAIFEEALNKKIIKRSGAYYNLEEQRFQGKTTLMDYLRENEEEVKNLEKQLLGNIEENETENEPEIEPEENGLVIDEDDTDEEVESGE